MPIVYKILEIDNILNRWGEYSLPEKKDRLQKFKKCFSEFIKHHNTQIYYKYLRGTHRKRLNTIDAELEVFESIRKDGLLHPIDMFVEGGAPIIVRGYRRLIMLDYLGYTTVPCRIFESREQFNRLRPSVKWR